MKMSEIEAPNLPLPIRVFGWFLLVGGIVSVLGIIASGGAFSPLRSGWNAISKLLGSASGYGFLRLRRWGPILYFAGYVTNMFLFYWLWPPCEEAVAQYSTPTVLAMAAIVPIGVGAGTAYYWRRFT